MLLTSTTIDALRSTSFALASASRALVPVVREVPAGLRTQSSTTRPSRGLSTASSRSNIPEDLRTAFGYCVSQTKKYDPENFAWCAQLPKQHRPAFFALRAFNAETALIAESVKSREAAMIQIRFQWWRDALQAIRRGSPPDHPVALALHHVMHPPESPSAGQRAAAAGAAGGSSGGVQGYNLGRIVSAREEDALAEQPPLRVADLEAYAEATASQLLYLQLQALGVRDSTADHAASHLGKAAAIANLLRGTAHHAARRRSYLPLEVCAQHGVSQEAVYRGEVSPGLQDAVLQVAAVAKAHLDEARALRPKVPRLARMALLPAVACGQYLAALQARDFNPFHSDLLGGGGVTPLTYTLRLKWHLLASSY